ncbi:AAA family ATPase [Clostridium sp.]|uniref:AAA family ATPase n=1 Tax=Clostridium sp. TaxID=1506 RepID=UPI00260D8A93|nr:AAA family ATPase [Clostridium sp.]
MGFRKPVAQKIGGKFLVYGFTHEGKSWFGLTFPKIAAIDSEAGLAFDEGKDITINGNKYNNLVLVDTTSDLDTLEENLDAILEGEVECDTLLIDSETKFYNTMDIGATEVEERKAKLAGKNVDARSKWGRIKNINMKLQQAKITLSAKGKHVVSTAQGSEVKDDDTQKVVGYKPDVHKSLPFDYDVVLRFYTEEDKKTKERKFYAEVLKDRTHVTTKGDIIENCTYDVWKSYFDERNKTGVKSTANYSNDLSKSVDGVLNKSEQSDKLSEEIKSLIKSFKGEVNIQKQIKDKIDEFKIDIKELNFVSPETLEELLKYIKSLK